MKIYILVMPGDYARANCDVFYSKEDAEDSKKIAKEDGERGTEYWYIKEFEV